MLSFIKEFHSSWMCDNFPIIQFTQNVYASVVHSMTLNSVAGTSRVSLSEDEITTIMENVISECLAHARSHITCLDEISEDDFDIEKCCQAEDITFFGQGKPATCQRFLQGAATACEEDDESSDNGDGGGGDCTSMHLVLEDTKLELKTDLQHTRDENAEMYSDAGSDYESDDDDKEADNLEEEEDMIHSDNLPVIEAMINWHSWSQFLQSLNIALHIRNVFLYATNNLNATTGHPIEVSRSGLPVTWQVVLNEVATVKCSAVQHILSMSGHAMLALYPGCRKGFGSDSVWDNVSGVESSTMLHGAHNFDNEIRNDTAFFGLLLCGFHVVTELTYVSSLEMCREMYHRRVKNKDSPSEFPSVDIKSAGFMDLNAEGNVLPNILSYLGIMIRGYTQHLNAERSLQENVKVLSLKQSSSSRDEMKLMLGDNFNPDISHMFHDSELTGFTIIVLILETHLQRELSFNADLEKDSVRWFILGYLYRFNNTITTFYYLYTRHGLPQNSTGVEKLELQDSCYAVMQGQHRATDWNLAKILRAHFAREMRDLASAMRKFAEHFFKDADEMSTMLREEGKDRRQLHSYLKENKVHLFTRSAELTTVTPLDHIQGICEDLSMWTDLLQFLFVSFVETRNATTVHQRSIIHKRSNQLSLDLLDIFGAYTQQPLSATPLDLKDAKESERPFDMKVAKEAAKNI